MAFWLSDIQSRDEMQVATILGALLVADYTFFWPSCGGLIAV